MKSTPTRTALGIAVIAIAFALLAHKQPVMSHVPEETSAAVAYRHAPEAPPEAPANQGRR